MKIGCMIICLVSFNEFILDRFFFIYLLIKKENKWIDVGKVYCDTNKILLKEN